MKEGSEVLNAIISIREHEYDHDLYEGIPESAIKRHVGENVAPSEIECLEQIGELERAADDSVTLTE